MAGPPEPRRLFEVGAELVGLASPSETNKAASRNETSRLPCPNETRDKVGPERDTDVEVLHRVAEGATLLAETQRQFDAAINAARAAGHSWRTIGILAGIPYQTLHRRSCRNDRANTFVEPL